MLCTINTASNRSNNHTSYEMVQTVWYDTRWFTQQSLGKGKWVIFREKWNLDKWKKNITGLSCFSGVSPYLLSTSYFAMKLADANSITLSDTAFTDMYWLYINLNFFFLNSWNLKSGAPSENASYAPGTRLRLNQNITPTKNWEFCEDMSTFKRK